MLRTALWAYDQQRKAMRWAVGDYWAVDESGQWTDHQLYSAIIFHGVSLPYNAFIAMMPYYGLYGQYHKFDDILRTARAIELDMVYAYHSKKLGLPYAPKKSGFLLSKGKITPYWRRVPLVTRLGAKLATRTIPVVGWALFAVDLWMVGKWIGDKTSPFD